ncbi:stage 0 sporulation family protein [bacterium]|nr:stage 0 sporulation family protein [candidate division CSSED10-310 bacterium]
MLEVVDILVRGETFSSRFNTQKIPVKAGDSCLVESTIGIQIGKVISNARVVKARCAGNNLPKIIRKTSEADLDILKQLQVLERESHRLCVQKIQSYRLEMKLVKVLFSFDRSKGLFMFTSEGRVDFRELVRDLAQHFKTRIEMKQIGIRDEARILGGIGNCGCPLCCVTFLRDFHPVSIKMAKDQGLSLIPSKISGLCGRLMCCLQYEHEHYASQAKSLPKVGKRVMTPAGEGRVRQLGILKNTVLVELHDGKLEEFKAVDVIPMHKYLEGIELAEESAASVSQDEDSDSDDLNSNDSGPVLKPDTSDMEPDKLADKPDPEGMDSDASDVPPTEQDSRIAGSEAKTGSTDMSPDTPNQITSRNDNGYGRRFGGNRRNRPRSGLSDTPTR